MTTEDAISYDSNMRQLICRNDWDIDHYSALQTSLEKISWPETGEISVDGSAIKKMDSAGAWLLSKWQNKLEMQGITVHIQKFSDDHQVLLSIVKKRIKEEQQFPEIKIPRWLARMGKYTVQQLQEFRDYLTFIGQLSYEIIRIVREPKHLRLASLAGVIYRTGYNALPIIALLSFMIGVVITYQMGLQLRIYGANVYIVDLLGLSVLREFGPLLTAIMVAGRTGSSFTAELGMMKINQEIDALNILGVTPAELLLLPKITGLIIALPLLTLWANFFGVVGGMFMANNMLNITWYDFLHRFPTVIPLRALLIGLGKAPVFAFIISSIACFQGMEVSGSAVSVGRNTTKSVVLAIFFIIVADAGFSVIFSKLKL